MPYKRKGNIVYVKRGGKWVKKSTCKSVKSAQRQINLLRGVEHSDWRPTGKKARDLRKKTTRKRYK